MDKPLLEILQLVKEEFLTLKYLTDDTYRGLCVVARYLRCNNILTYNDSVEFEKYLRNSFNANKRVFYNDYGKRSASDSQYYWMPRIKPPRIKWLDKHIALLK